MLAMVNFFNRFYLHFSNKQLVYLYVVLSLILSWRLNYVQHGWVNNDFVLYHESARLFLAGEWKQAFDTFQWPFYSILIAILTKLLGTDLHLSAQILSVLFFALVTFGILTIIRISNGQRLTISCGALILFSSTYLVGDVLPMLLRDSGAWAFFLLAIVFFVRFYRTNSWLDSILWQFSAIFATLFRIEYITYLVLIPFLVLFNSKLNLYQKNSKFIKAHLISIILFVCLIISLTVSSSLSIDDFGRLKEVPSLFTDKYQTSVEVFRNKAEIMDRLVLNGDWSSYSTFALFFSFLVMAALTSFSTLGWLNTILLFFTKVKLMQISADTRKILFFSVLLSLLNILVILFSVFLLAGRYTAPLAFAMMILTSFSLAYLIIQSGKSDSYIFRGSVFFIVIFLMVGLLKNIWPKSEGINFQQNAVAWLKSNHIENNQVFFDNSRMRYYAKAQFDGIIDKKSHYLEDAIESHEIENYKFLVINHSSNQKGREELIAKKLPQFKIVQRFYGVKNKKSVVIYEKVSK